MISPSQLYFGQLQSLIPLMPFPMIDKACNYLFQAYEERRTVFLFGNGGSAALASHMACDLGKGTSSPENPTRFRALALTDNIATITALANDLSYHEIFAEQLTNLGQVGDLAVAISCSGNSPNVINALKVARQREMTTIGIGGFDGGRMKALCDLSVIVPSHNMQLVEDLHLCAAHCIFNVLRDYIHQSTALKAAAGATTHSRRLA